MNQEDLFEENLSSSQVDTHVSRSRLQVVGEAKKTLATSIRTSKELLNKSDPLGQFTKMFMDTSQWDLTRFSFKWKPIITQRGRLCFRLVQSELYTKGTECGSSVETWATPNTMDHLPPRSEEATKKLQNGHRKGRKRPSNLREQVDPNTIKLYPTPRASDVEGGMASNVEINNGRFSEEEQGRSSVGSEVEGCRESHGNIPDTPSIRIQRLWSSWEQESDSHGQSVISVCQSERSPQTIWKVEPCVDRVVDGLPKRVDRIKGLGNAIVPQNAMIIANAIERSL